MSLPLLRCYRKRFKEDFFDFVIHFWKAVLEMSSMNAV
jgi:hypothetical protein